jgi:hypothetical protein
MTALSVVILINELRIQNVVNTKKLVKFEALTSTRINITIFWHVTPCSLISWLQNFLSISMVEREPALKMETRCSIESLTQLTKPHGIIPQNIMCAIFRTCLNFKAHWCPDVPATVTLDVPFPMVCHSSCASRDSEN